MDFEIYEILEEIINSYISKIHITILFEQTSNSKVTVRLFCALNRKDKTGNSTAPVTLRRIVDKSHMSVVNQHPSKLAHSNALILLGGRNRHRDSTSLNGFFFKMSTVYLPLM